MPSLIVLIGMLAGAEQDSFAVELSASTTTPYVGQVVDLTLRVKGKPPEQAEVVLPWLTADPKRWLWRAPLEQWLNQQIRPAPGALALRWQGRSVSMPQVAPGVYEWRWQIVVQDATTDDDLPVRLGAAQVGAVRSQPLVLEARRPPVMSNTPRVWNLGVGNFSVSAEWNQPRAVLGQEAELAITVSGNGELERISAPTLAGLPGWGRESFLIERMPEGAREPSAPRVFRYSIRPRRLGILAPAGLVVRWFDPDAGVIQTRPVKVPALEVGSAAETSPNVVPGRALYVEDAWVRVSQEFQRELREHGKNVTNWGTLSGVLVWLPVLAAVGIILQVWVQRSRPAWWERSRRRRAARRAARRLAREDLSPRLAREILSEWLGTVSERNVTPELGSLLMSYEVAGVSGEFWSLIRAVEQWEFGPHYPGQRDEVRGLAGSVFREQGAA